jgi:hypothetical protein
MFERNITKDNENDHLSCIARTYLIFSTATKHNLNFYFIFLNTGTEKSKPSQKNTPSRRYSDEANDITIIVDIVGFRTSCVVTAYLAELSTSPSPTNVNIVVATIRRYSLTACSLSRLCDRRHRCQDHG